MLPMGTVMNVILTGSASRTVVVEVIQFVEKESSRMMMVTVKRLAKVANNSTLKASAPAVMKAMSGMRVGYAVGSSTIVRTTSAKGFSKIHVSQIKMGRASLERLQPYRGV